MMNEVLIAGENRSGKTADVLLFSCSPNDAVCCCTLPDQSDSNRREPQFTSRNAGLLLPYLSLPYDNKQRIILMAR